MKQRLMWASSGLALAALCGCATTRPPPTELQNARVAVQRAETGPAATQDPPGVIEARQALDAAEHEYQQDQKSKDVETLGYVAERKAETAEADSRAIEVARGRGEKQEEALDRSERRAKVALEQLGLAAKDDERGTVITLPTENMFAVDQATILPSAREPLVEITKAVKKVVAERAPQDVGRTIKLVGFTDSTGTDEHNLDLSMRRAEAVRDFFSKHGLDATKMEIEAQGEAAPIADNSTEVGRAQNRRVEIVVTKAAAGFVP